MSSAIYIVLITAVISGFSNFINKLMMDSVGGTPFVYTTAKNLLTALILSGIFLSPLVFRSLKELTRSDRLKLIAVGLIGGSVPFLLYFQGLSLTSAVSASFIHKTLFVFVAIGAYFFLSERLTKLQLGAAGLLLLGNYSLGGFNGFAWDAGEQLILAAVLFWTVEYLFIKKYLAQIDFKIIAWARMFFGAIFLLLFLMFNGQVSTLVNYSLENWLFIGVTSILLCGYVLTWYYSLQKLPATVVTSFLVVASPITTLLNNWWTGKDYTLPQIVGSILMLFGVVFLVDGVSFVKEKWKSIYLRI